MSQPLLDIVFVGLSITSSWGNGHATTYRSLIRGLAERGHRVTFLERDVPWYADNRDAPKPDGCEVVLYSGLPELFELHAARLREADAVVLGSYVPDGVQVGRWLSSLLRCPFVFYDIDTPVTLDKLSRGDQEYVSADLIPRFDAYLSFTGGPTLRKLEQVYGARRALPLYCSVDPEHYYPSEVGVDYDLGYLGTYSADRQPTLDRLLVEPARQDPKLRSIVAGPCYPDSIAWPANVRRVEHLSPGQHRDFYCSQRFTLNVTRAPMIDLGYSPSVRLFEAAACGTPIISDVWDGIETIFRPEREILLARSAREMHHWLKSFGQDEARALGARARERALREHTSAHRAEQLEGYLATLLGKVRSHERVATATSTTVT